MQCTYIRFAGLKAFITRCTLKSPMSETTAAVQVVLYRTASVWRVSSVQVLSGSSGMARRKVMLAPPPGVSGVPPRTLSSPGRVSGMMGPNGLPADFMRRSRRICHLHMTQIARSGSAKLVHATGAEEIARQSRPKAAAPLLDATIHLAGLTWLASLGWPSWGGGAPRWCGQARM
jgi:hypothetical protein